VIKSVLKYLATPVGLILVGIIGFQFMMAKINHLQAENAGLKQKAASAELLAQARADTIRAIGQYLPLPETVQIKVRVPVIIHPPQTDTGEIRMTRADWDKYYRDNCTGLIRGRDSMIWTNGAGALADYGFYYGLGTNEYNWMTILPCGNWQQAAKLPKVGLSGGIEWHITPGAIRIGGDITWRSKWAPSIGLEIKDKTTTWQFGVRRSF
jgi:hypothetical protein